MRTAAIIIPVRWSSNRFPGKPLAMIKGKTMLERVWQIAKSVKNASAVWIASDDDKIIKHALSLGAQAVLTSSSCVNGTERVLDAVKRLKLKAEIYLNLQGDTPLVPPWILEALIGKMADDPGVKIATSAVRVSAQLLAKLREGAKAGQPGATTVTFDVTGKALYFSKSLIPHLRDPQASNPPVYKHLGVYAYTKEALEQWVALPPGVFESAEQLEQLRALENGLAIDVVLADTKGRSLWSVDNPEDVAIIEEILEQEGELQGGGG